MSSSKHCVLALLALALLLSLRGPICISQAWENAGLVVLSRALVGAPANAMGHAAAQAQALLQRALAYAVENRTTWWWLGLALLTQGREDDAMATWQYGGVSPQAFIAYGERAREAGWYQEALAWYERAVRMEPPSGDPWYCMGLTYEDTEQWDKALEMYEQALEVGVTSWTGTSSIYCRMGMIYQLRLEPQQVKEALAAYEVAMKENDIGTGWSADHAQEVADCYYEYGALSREVEGPGTVDQYIRQFRRALEIFPGHYRARVLLGIAHYERDGDIAAAERELGLAIQNSPRSLRAYYALGEIYRREGMQVQAIEVYSRVLEIDPGDERARQILQGLRSGIEEGK